MSVPGTVHASVRYLGTYLAIDTILRFVTGYTFLNHLLKMFGTGAVGTGYLAPEITLTP